MILYYSILGMIRTHKKIKKGMKKDKENVIKIKKGMNWCIEAFFLE